MNARPNIVLVHGAWADGSCWAGVIEHLQADGYHVTAPQFPLTALLSQGPVTPALEHLFTDARGFGWLSEDDFVSHFAADVDPVKAKVMYAVQQALATSAFGEVMGVPAWKTLPSWYLVAADDQAILPDVERLFASRMAATTVEISSSHLPMVSHPGEVARLIETAADAVAAAS
jgi:pimeloyl-ACP methyl ester carboxylesterase